MQAPTTLTRGNGLNQLTVGAIGLALLAASTIGAIALNDHTDLPFVGSDSQAQATVVDSMAQIQMIEQNSFDYAASAPVDARFLEENSWDYQPVANYASVASIRLVEENTFDYVTPVTSGSIRFDEANSWDYEVQAHPAGDVATTGSARNFLFQEENVWERDSPMIPPANTRAIDY